MADLILQFKRTLPKILEDAGEDASSRVIEFFTAEIRNPNTREETSCHFLVPTGSASTP